MRRELNDLRAKNSELVEKTDTLQAQDDILEAKYRDLGAKLAALESQNSNQATKITALETRLNSSEFTSSKKEKVYLLAHSNDYQAYSSNLRFKFKRMISNAGTSNPKYYL